VIAARKLSSAASAAYASVQHVRSWLLGTAPGEIVSMGVISDGSYGVPEGLVFSFPVRCVAGNYTIVQGLPIDDFSREQIEVTKQELIEERDSALTFAWSPLISLSFLFLDLETKPFPPSRVSSESFFLFY
jgi:malate/lactate dehydrogenase